MEMNIKLAGLAPYGKPSYLDEMKKVTILKSSGEFELQFRIFVDIIKKKLNMNGKMVLQ